MSTVNSLHAICKTLSRTRLKHLLLLACSNVALLLSFINTFWGLGVDQQARAQMRWVRCIYLEMRNKQQASTGKDVEEFVQRPVPFAIPLCETWRYRECILLIFTVYSVRCFWMLVRSGMEVGRNGEIYSDGHLLRTCGNFPKRSGMKISSHLAPLRF